MKKHFTCPHCDAVLNPNVKVVLVVTYRKRRGMILLSPQPGNYKYICDKSVEERLQHGAKVKFSCPVCAADLTSPANTKFAELHMGAPGQEPMKVEFSRVFGTHATFVIDGEEVTTYGEDVENFGNTNFFGY
jgi:hypothetical protein